MHRIANLLRWIARFLIGFALSPVILLGAIYDLLKRCFNEGQKITAKLIRALNDD